MCLYGKSYLHTLPSNLLITRAWRMATRFAFAKKEIWRLASCQEISVGYSCYILCRRLLYLCTFAAVILKAKQHDVFQRKNADLLMSKKLSLHEALCGFQFKFVAFFWFIAVAIVSNNRFRTRFKHLDGREILIKSKPGQVVADNSLKMLSGEGFPHRVWLAISEETNHRNLRAHRETNTKEARCLSIFWSTYLAMENSVQHSNAKFEQFLPAAPRRHYVHAQKTREFFWSRSRRMTLGYALQMWLVQTA